MPAEYERPLVSGNTGSAGFLRRAIEDGEAIDPAELS
jgi:hypothetical protein